MCNSCYHLAKDRAGKVPAPRRPTGGAYAHIHERCPLCGKREHCVRLCETCLRTELLARDAVYGPIEGCRVCIAEGRPSDGRAAYNSAPMTRGLCKKHYERAKDRVGRITYDASAHATARNLARKRTAHPTQVRVTPGETHGCVRCAKTGRVPRNAHQGIYCRDCRRFYRETAGRVGHNAITAPWRGGTTPRPGVSPARAAWCAWLDRARPKAGSAPTLAAWLRSLPTRVQSDLARCYGAEHECGAPKVPFADATAARIAAALAAEL